MKPRGQVSQIDFEPRQGWFTSQPWSSFKDIPLRSSIIPHRRQTTGLVLGSVNGWQVVVASVRLAALVCGLVSTLQALAQEPKAADSGPPPRLVDAASAADKLRAPGSDRYGPKVDWANIPPWRQASFYGIRSQGQVFVYVVDCSGSMIEDARLARAKIEVRRSIMALQYPQRFKVIFYNEAPLPSPGDAPKSADLAGKDQLLRWMSAIEPNGETDPRAAMKLALALRPDAIFLLSDGEYPEGAADAIAKSNTGRIPVNCVDLSGGAGGNQLKKISADSGGQYISRP